MNVGVIGGGVTGLSAAYYLARLGQNVTLIEASKRPGGWIHSIKRKNGAIFELGPRSLRVPGRAGINTIELADSLQLTDSVIPVTSKSPAVKNRFIWANRKLNVLPSSVFGILQKQDPFSEPLIWTITKEAFRKRVESEDESVYSFIERRFGGQIAKYAIDPMMRGIFAGDARDLSVTACLPGLLDYEQFFGSVVRGMLLAKKPKIESKSSLVAKSRNDRWAIWTLKGGLQDLTDRLKEECNKLGVQVVTECQGASLEFDGGGATLKTNKDDLKLDHVMSTIYSKDLSAILPHKHNDLKDLLNGIDSATVAVVNLEYDGKVLPVQGFGHLVPSTEPSKVLGVVYDSDCFPEHNSPEKPTTRLTCMMGGAWYNNLFGSKITGSETYIEQTAIDSVREQLGINTDPQWIKVSIQKNCIPQYKVGHLKLLDKMDAYISFHNIPLTLLGSSYRGASVNDCINNAKIAAEKLTNKKFSYT